MKNATQYYQNSIQKNIPSPLLKKFFGYKYNEKLTGNIAIDIGCGAGNDTIHLLNKGFKVTAIDNEPQVKELFKNRIEVNKNLEIIIDDFSKIQLHKADLIFANFSLFFVKKDFNLLLENVIKSINKKGFFVGNFLGPEDDWIKSKAIVEKEELLNYFSDFKIMYFSEEKYYQDTITKKNKFWHVYTIMAQRK